MSFFSSKLEFIKIQLFNASPLQKKVFGGGVWAIVGKITLSGTGLLLNAILARILSPEEMGAYFIAISILSAVGIFMMLGLDRTIVRLIAEAIANGQPGRARQAIQWVLIMLTASGLSGITFMAIGGEWITNDFFHSPLLGDLIWIITLWTVFATFQNLLAEIFRGFHDIRLAASLGGGGALTRTVLLLFVGAVWIWQGSSNLYQIMVLSVTANVITVIVAVLILGNRIIKLPSSKILPREILVISWPLWVNSVGLLILNQADIWILGAFRPSSEVAIYGVIFRLAIIASTPLLIINAVIPPIIAELYFKGEKYKLEQILRSTATLVSVPAILLFLMFLIWGKDILSFLFGAQYRIGYPILVIISLGQLINTLTGSCGNLMVMTGFQKEFMILTLTVGILSLVLQIIFVPIWGIFASAVFSAGSIAFATLFYAFYSQFFIGIRTWPGKLRFKCSND